MDTEKIIDGVCNFFNLDKESSLFNQAIKPRSCGGDAKFEQLAAYGDLILDLNLVTHLISQGYETKGDITQERQKIHRENILVAFANELQIGNILYPLSGEVLGNKDLSECIEALLGANFQTHGLLESEIIVNNLIKIFEEQELYNSSTSSEEFADPISKLNQLYQNKNNKNFPNELLNPERIGGQDHNPIYKVDTHIKFGNEDFHVVSDEFNSKKDAKQNAALNLLNQIRGQSPIPIINERKQSEKVVTTSYSMDDEQLIFDKLDMDRTMNISTNTEENLIDWITRKSKKPFGMLVLLSARLSDLSYSSWNCSIQSGELVLLNIQFGENDYFCIGNGSSKSKARKDAGYQVLERSSLLDWLNETYSDYKI